MDRRGFLKLFATALPVAAVAPTYFFAPIGGWESDIIASPWDGNVYPAYGGLDRKALYNEIDALTLDALRKNIIYDNFFASSPFQMKLRAEVGKWTDADS